MKKHFIAKTNEEGIVLFLTEKAIDKAVFRIPKNIDIKENDAIFFKGYNIEHTYVFKQIDIREPKVKAWQKKYYFAETFLRRITKEEFEKLSSVLKTKP